MKSSEKDYDDLTAITGIGPARQRWLRESLLVRTYLDLANLSVDEIESRLKADGQIQSRNAIEVWLAQSQELAARTGQMSATEHKVADVNTAGEANSAAREDGWKPFASFVVEFQVREIPGQPKERRTAVHHMEKDTGTYWPSIESRSLCQWMLSQIPGELRSDLKEDEWIEQGLAETIPGKEPSASVSIGQLRVFQPPEAELPAHTIRAGRPFQGVIKGDEPFTLEVDFELIGPLASDAAGKQIACNAQSYAYSKASRTTMHLGNSETESFIEGKLDYTFTLPQVTVPQGDYRLWVLVTPEGALATPDFVELPDFQVA